MRILNILIVLFMFSSSMAVAGDPKWKELRRKKIERDLAHKGKIAPDPRQDEAVLAWERKVAERKERAREHAAQEWEARTYNLEVINPIPAKEMLADEEVEVIGPPWAEEPSVDEEEDYDSEAWMYDPKFRANYDQGVSML